MAEIFVGAGFDARETRRGTVVTIPGILFEYDSSVLMPQAQARIQEVALLLNDHEDTEGRIWVEGHTDDKGSNAYNLELSQARAETVADILVLSRIPESRVHVRAFGESRPVASNSLPNGKDNPEGRSRNRRVELIIEADSTPKAAGTSFE